MDVGRFTAGIFKMANTRGLGADSTEAAMLKEAPAAAQLEYMGIVGDVSLRWRGRCRCGG